MNENETLDKVPTGLFIGGEWRDSSDGSTIDVEDPATGETLTTVASATPEDGKAALDAAVDAQHDWAATAPRERAEILRSAFELITERADYFAMLMTLEMGKPLAQSKGEVTYGAEFFRWFSEEVVRDRRPVGDLAGRQHPADDDEAAGRSDADDHAVELPAGDGHPQDRAGHRRRLHDGGQAGPADPADDARPGRPARGGRRPRRGAQRRSPPPTPAR